MFSWIWYLFNKREEFGVYHPKERMIYKYWNGQKLVEADPLLLVKKMMDVAPSLSAASKVAKSPSKDAPAAQEEMIGYIRGIFSVDPYEQGGLTRSELVNLIDHFSVYCEEIKKKVNASLTTSTLPEQGKTQ